MDICLTDVEDSADTDGDSMGDSCPTSPDTCPLNPSWYSDFDGDNVGPECDNCLYISNADQADANNNGIGDACEVLGGSTGFPANWYASHDPYRRIASRVNPREVQIPATFQCAGEIPDNAQLCTNDDDGLVEEVTRSLGVCTDNVKCEYTCINGFIFQDGICVAIPPVQLCGNNVIDAGETCLSCAGDVSCPLDQRCNDAGACVVIPLPQLCDNNVVDAGETCLTCGTDVTCAANQRCNDVGECVANPPPIDPACGDGNIDADETCLSCNTDVTCADNQRCDDDGVCVAIPPPQLCGNNVIDAGETCLSCGADVSCAANQRCDDTGACVAVAIPGVQSARGTKIIIEEVALANNVYQTKITATEDITTSFTVVTELLVLDTQRRETVVVLEARVINPLRSEQSVAISTIEPSGQVVRKRVIIYDSPNPATWTVHTNEPFTVEYPN